MSIITTDALTRRFGHITALDGLSVDLPDGVTGLVGANGAGKSTLIKILLGLLPATTGAAQVLDMDVAHDGERIRERVGYMPEHDCLPPDVTATEFVVHMARMSGLPSIAARERTADTLRHVGLYEERYRLIGGYSTGMRQRVKLAQALVHDPSLVLLDEPTNGLDPTGRDDMLGLIQRIGADFGISVLVTSHLLGELERICDHVVVVDAGHLLQSSSTAAVTQSSGTLAVEVTDRLSDLVVLLGRAGLTVFVPDPTQDGPPSAERVVEVVVRDDETYDLVRDAVVELGVGLVRMQPRRHHISEIFRTAPAAPGGPTSSPSAADDGRAAR